MAKEYWIYRFRSYFQLVHQIVLDNISPLFFFFFSSASLIVERSLRAFCANSREWIVFFSSVSRIKKKKEEYSRDYLQIVKNYNIGKYSIGRENYYTVTLNKRVNV